MVCVLLYLCWLPELETKQGIFLHKLLYHWGGAPVWGLTWKPPKSKQQQLASNQRWGSFIKSLPVENLSPPAIVCLFLEPGPLCFHSLPFCERLLSFFTLLFLTLALSAFAILLIKIANWMDVYNKCLKFSENPKSGSQVWEGLVSKLLACCGSYFLSIERGLNTMLIVKSLSVGEGSFR